MERPSIRSYSLRGNRMTRAQGEAINQHWDQYAIPLDQQLNLNQIFPDKQKVILEIGSGMGEATAQIAQATPNTGYVAVEMHEPGLAALLMLIVEKELKNIKFIREDAIYLLTHFIADASLDGNHIVCADGVRKVKAGSIYSYCN